MAGNIMFIRQTNVQYMVSVFEQQLKTGIEL